MTMSMTEIDKALRQLRLSGVRATLETRILEAQAANLSFLETFSTILQDELDRRQSRLLERRYQLSGLDERASLAEFDWGYNPKIPKRACFELHTLKFVAEGDSGLLIGPPGTGKSHVVKAIAYFLTSLSGLTASDKRRRVQPLIDADLVVFDDLFLARQLPSESADTLQSILHKRYKLRRSSLITSNRIIDDWHKFLGDAALATAILDRLLHRSLLLEFKGKSYRLKEAANRLAKATHSE